MNCEKDLIDIVATLFTPIIAVVAIYIAFQQKRINEERFKHDLFDKRLVMYEATKELFRYVLVGDEIKKNNLDDYRYATKGSIFIFSSETSSYLNEVYTNSLKLNASIKNKNMDEDLFDWFVSEFDQIDNRFMDELKINMDLL